VHLYEPSPNGGAPPRMMGDTEGNMTMQ